MSKTPKISVLMSAYNTEKYIAESIESILNQTFKDFEFIIINDGSTDKTAQIIKKYAKQDKRIKFIDCKKNAGLIAALNKGLELCRGKYIARMDADDISVPTRFEKQIKYMEKHPECGVLGGLHEKFGDGIKNMVIYRYQPKVKMLDFLLHGNLVSHPTVLIRKEILTKNNIKYDSNCPYAEDFAFWTEIVKHTEIHNLQEVLLKYRWHKENVSLVHKKIQDDSAEKVRKNIVNYLCSSDYDKDKLLEITKTTNKRFWLFGILPIIRRKQYSIVKTKYYLFEKLPIFRVQNGKIYLFKIIKIGFMK
ncbi:MAG: glycosyltransferase family 2 protein [Alphaproteobacteria bacterium]|nr:glycosyltransferase family 2 protein [Alphaproteobacteria bacterium]